MPHTPESTVYVGGGLFRAGVGSVPGWGVRVDGDRISQVLPDAALRSGADASTRIVELDGRFLSPGFIDAHFHPTVGGVELGLCELSAASSADECLELIRAYADANPELPWIVGGGWSMDLFPGGNPRREDLDRVTGGRPAMLANRDHHGHWANTEALRLAGVTADTPDPAGGRIERDPDGSPTGSLHEAAGELVNRLRPVTTEEEIAAGLLRGQALAFSLGVTGWQDAIVGASSVGPDNLSAYLTTATDGRLKARIGMALWWDRDRGLEQIDELVARRAHVAETAPWLRASAVKIMVDGVAENYTAAVSSPYLDAHGHVTGNCGHSFIDPAQLKEAVQRLDAFGFQAHFHALGDRAVTEALDAVAHARAVNGWSDTRPHLAHLQMVTLADVSRFTALGATANLQALWAQAESQMLELTLPYLDPALRDRQYPFADLLHAGVTLAAGSDWPVSSAFPLDAMQVAVTRHGEGANAVRLLPEQSLSLERIWAAYTQGSAWVTHREHDTGALDPGKLADFAILDRDPFAGDVEDIATARVTTTVVGGTTVYEETPA